MSALVHERVTRELLVDWDACYDADRIDECFDGRDSLTAPDVLDLDIPTDDLIWVLSHMLTERAAREFACECAERALPLFEPATPGDTRPSDCIATARAYARGFATADELFAARSAAKSAAGPAAKSASKSAAWSAAWSAAESAAESAGSAAKSAAKSAAWSAAQSAQSAQSAWYAARSAEQQYQLNRLRELAGGVR